MYCREIALQKDERLEEDSRSFLLTLLDGFIRSVSRGSMEERHWTHPERDGHDLNGKRIQKKEGVYVCIYFVHFAVCRN